MKHIRRLFLALLVTLGILVGSTGTALAAVSQAWTPNLFLTPATTSQTDNGYSNYYDLVMGGDGDVCRPDPNQPPICFYYLHNEFYYAGSDFVVTGYYIAANNTGTTVTCSHNSTVKWIRCSTDDDIQIGTHYALQVQGYWTSTGTKTVWSRSRVSCGDPSCATSGWDMSDDLVHSVS